MFTKKGIQFNTGQKKDKGESISQILDKFHKMKETRFKGKDRNKKRSFTHSSRSDTKFKLETSNKSSSMDTNKTNSMDTNKSSSMNSLDKIADASSPPADIRMSLPSIFHPMKPLPPSQSHGNETLERQLEKDIRIPVQGPRFSMSYVLQAYSRANIAEAEVKTQSENEHQSNNKDIDNKTRTHHFKKAHGSYPKDRESPSRSHDRKRVQGYRKLPPLGLEDDVAVSSSRSRSTPRVFSY